MSAAVPGDVLRYEPRSGPPQVLTVTRVTGGTTKHVTLRTTCPACGGGYVLRRWTDRVGVWALDVAKNRDRVRRCGACRATGKRPSADLDEPPMVERIQPLRSYAAPVVKPVDLRALAVGDLVRYRGQSYTVVQVRQHDHGRRYWLRSRCSACGRDYVTCRVPEHQTALALRCPGCVRDMGAKWRYHPR